MKKFLLLLVSGLIASLSSFARTIEISGNVKFAGSQEPAPGIWIYNYVDDDNETMLGQTDEAGNFLIVTDSEARLRFGGNCTDAFEDVAGRLQINVEVLRKSRSLNEVIVIGKAGNMSLVVEPADLVMEGDWIKWTTPVKIPRQLFDRSSRMIVQPAICDVTTSEVFFKKPEIVDGWRYANTQDRMHDWHAETTDTLNPFVDIKTRDFRKETTVWLIDSFKPEVKSHDFMLTILCSLEDYNKIKYTDSLEIGRGTINPLRFLNYSLEPLPLNDESFIPHQEKELRDASGEMNLVFPVGKSELDLSMGNNANEFESLLNEFRTINSSQGMTLKQFSIYGYASPEGRYESNKKLAGNRMNSAMAYVTDRINAIEPTLLRNVDLSSDADVAGWEEVGKMLRTDSLFEEADRVAELLDRYSTADARSRAMKRLPFYSNVIVRDYLPRMRRVNYRIVTEYLRPLTDEEISELYHTDPSGLSRYQFYRYYTAHTGKEREEALHKAVEVWPDFIAAATELSEVMLQKGENPREILEPFFTDITKWRSRPEAMRYNMALCRMKDQQYSRADSLLSTVSDTELTHKAIIYCMAMNGHYRKVIDEVSKDSPLNAVLMRLKINDNNAAARMALKLGNTAVEEYVKAVALNRVDDWTAIDHLNEAFRLDPSLKAVAKTDGDLLGLIENEGVDLD
ncbi:MAG: carboxypeptidase-like regulatory domain-containing protein [Bacteroides sp.]|nr:carboxypeptidase-like regulatory domain-containing protein [Bacteroides sp.]MCM1379687.1 carboxypeptidase-like regulatory domain-containing protein [Bacteroides sp.]MCM1446042.1 carboxypeptidase-like regulatory domain-containing protein [Prevotella sp.]